MPKNLSARLTQSTSLRQFNTITGEPSWRSESKRNTDARPLSEQIRAEHIKLFGHPPSEQKRMESEYE